MASGIIPAPSMQVVSNTNISSQTIPSGLNVTTNLAEINLPKAGKWILFATASFTLNQSGIRQLGVSNSPTLIWQGRTYGQQADASQNGNTKIFLTILIVTQGSAKYYLNAKQNSGNDLLVEGIGYQAICLS